MTTPLEPDPASAVGDSSALPAEATRLRLSTLIGVGAFIVIVLLAAWSVGPDTPWEIARRSTTPAVALAAVAGDEARFGGVTDCGEHAIACVTLGSVVVHVSPEFADVDEGELTETQHMSWIDIMRHEYMHVLQGRLVEELEVDPEFYVLFAATPAKAAGDDYWDGTDWAIELSAECMAEITYSDYERIYPGRCTTQQLRYAERLVAAARAAHAR
ncbi:MAG: hypothetical protein QM598_08585 [Protaetiibacter sp.]